MEKLPFLILLVIGGALMLAGWRSIRTGQVAQAGVNQLAAEGVETQAQVTAKRSYPHPRHGRPGWFVDYAFTAETPGAGPRTFNSLAQVSQADYDRLNVGDAVSARYARSDPKNSTLAIGMGGPAAPMFTTDGVGGLAIGAVMIVIGVAAWLR